MKWMVDSSKCEEESCISAIFKIETRVGPVDGVTTRRSGRLVWLGLTYPTQGQARYPFEVPAVPCQEDAPVGHDDFGDQTVPPANPPAVSLPGSANLGPPLPTPPLAG